MRIRVCAVKLWLLLLHITALWNLAPCFALEYIMGEIGAPPTLVSVGVPDRWEAKYEAWENSGSKYFYVHNETRIAMARAQAHHDSGGAASDGTPPSSILGTATYPDFASSEDGCNWDRTSDLSFFTNMMWDESPRRDIDLQFLAVDSCALNPTVWVGNQVFEISSQEWDKEKSSILIRADPNPSSHSFKVLVTLRAGGMEILADGVYLPATGKTHLVGCILRQQQRPDFSIYSDLTPSALEEFTLPLATPPAEPYWYDPDTHRVPPLNSSALDDCAISATLQYPPLTSRWNRDRVVKFSIRSTRAENDSHYFPPIEGSSFFPYLLRRLYSEGSVDIIMVQRRVETESRILLLVLGLVCIALQIKHGRNNEESLPFVSLVMLAIQLAHHFSQLSIFKDLQIFGYHQSGGSHGVYHNVAGRKYPWFPDAGEDYGYYGIMARSEYVPYQPMAMAAIFMYIWIFLKVGDRRRIMKLRVLKRRPGATDPPGDWLVMYLTLPIFFFVISLGLLLITMDQSGDFNGGVTVMLDDSYSYNAYYSPFVPIKFYKLSQAQWGLVNKLTGLMVSFFLVPQLLGNVQWDLQGRPLSMWFYAGIPILQSLPQVFSIAKYFQVVPIFPSFDPYMDSTYGTFENPTPWWQIGVVLLSALQVLAVHFQFEAGSLHGSGLAFNSENL